MKKNYTIIISFLIIIVLIISCNQAKDSKSISQNIESKFHALKGPYLGQTLPGDTAELFVKNLITGKGTVGQINFTPDGDEFMYRLSTPRRRYLAEPKGIYDKSFFLVSKIENGRWTDPVELIFNPEHRVGYFCYSPDGLKVYFNSRGPINDTTYKTSSRIWCAERQGEKWSVPTELILGDSCEGGAFPSVASSGNIYFQKWARGESHGKIYVSKYKNGKYLKPERLSDIVNTPGGAHPFIAPDESYIIFDSYNAGGEEYGSVDLYISYKDKDGIWTKPVNMGPRVNSAGVDKRPFVSSDKKYMFFASNRVNPKLPEKPASLKEIQDLMNNYEDGYQNIYWINANIIEELKPTF